MRAIDATRKPPVTIDAAETIRTAARRMHEAHVGALVVVDQGRPIGIVTDRDVVVRGVAHDSPSDARVDSLMTPGVMAFDADGDLRDALSVLRAHAFRRLPLVRDGQVVALLSTDDVLIELARELVDVVHPITGQVLYPEPEHALPPVPAST
jgi:CBS domain-containing protein